MPIDAGKLLRDARKSAGLTQADLAERLQVAQSSVARLESPRSNPRLETLDRALLATGNRLRVGREPVAHPGIDGSLIAANLARTPAERLADFERAYKGFRRLAPTVRSGG
jgi:transcriptional regulator with XRE-family HTH domain